MNAICSLSKSAPSAVSFISILPRQLLSRLLVAQRLVEQRVEERGIRQRGLVLHPRGEAFHFCPTPLFAARARFPLKNMVHVHLG